MRTYVVIAGGIFGLLTAAHIWRIAVEPNLASDPWFIATTIASALLAIGAWRVARRAPHA